MKISRSTLNLAGFVKCSQIYGPGKRFVIWFQGCSLHCKGCWNQEMWNFNPNQLYTISELFNLVIEEENIEGITILGGEPLDQSDGLFEFIQQIKQTKLTIMLYTGYEKDEIELDCLKKQICDYSDIVILGRYNENLRSIGLKWRGSSNQEIIINNKDYHKIINEYPEQNEVEIHINQNGELILLGYPDETLTEEFFS